MRETRSQDVVLLLLRLVLGLVFIYAGGQKLFGWWGGSGFSGTLQEFQSMHGIPAVATACAIFAEFLGGLGVLFGFLSRVAASGLFLTMAVAVFLNMRDFGAKALSSEPEMSMLFIAMPLSMLVMSLAVMMLGAGKYSLDQKFSKRK